MSEIEPVKVHIESVAAGLGLAVPVPAAPAGPPPRRQVYCRPYTVVLTSTNPVQTILDADPNRLYALVQTVGSNDAVINNNNGEAHNAANQTTGLPNPIGMLLPHGNAGPVKIPGTERWWASAAAYPAEVTVLVVMEG